MKKIIVVLAAATFAFQTLGAQETVSVGVPEVSQDSVAVEPASSFEPAHFYGGAEFTSNYIWRGLKYADNPAVTPTVGFGVAGFNVYFTGAYGVGHEYAEFDMCLSYEWKGLRIEVDDYFCPYLPGDPGSEDDPIYDFFNFRKHETGHQVDVMLAYEPENIPIRAMWSTIVYGCDYKAEDDEAVANQELRQAYSSYAELGYWHEFGDYGRVDATVGACIMPSEMYGTNRFGVVNLGLRYSKAFDVNIAEIPVFAQFTFNPYAHKPYLTFGVGIDF